MSGLETAEREVAMLLTSIGSSLLTIDNMNAILTCLADDTTTTALKSCILGELEEVERQGNTFPLTSFFHSCSAYEKRLEVTRPRGQLLPWLQAVVGLMSKGKTVLAGRKRKFLVANAHLWHFLNGDQAHDFCFVLILVDVARRLGVRQVVSMASESHCWIGWADQDDQEDQGVEKVEKVEKVDRAETVEQHDNVHNLGTRGVDHVQFFDVLPPDRSPRDMVNVVDDKRKGWAYQRDAKGVCRATLLSDAQFVACMVQRVAVSAAVKLQLMSAIPVGIQESVPGFVLEQAVLNEQLGQIDEARRLYNRAVELAVERWDNALVYPHMQRAFFFAAQKEHEEALVGFAEAARIVSTYRLLDTDVELLDEATVAAAFVCDNVVPALVSKHADSVDMLRDTFAQIVVLFDHLIAWIESAHVDPGVAWRISTSLALASHFPAATRRVFGATATPQAYTSRVIRRVVESIVALDDSTDLLVADVEATFHACALHPRTEEKPTEPTPEQLAAAYTAASLPGVRPLPDETEPRRRNKRAPKPKQNNRKRAQRASRKKTKNVNDEEDDDVVEWTQCESCQVWRELPSTVAAATLPDTWTCDLATWPLTNPRSCQL